MTTREPTTWKIDSGMVLLIALLMAPAAIRGPIYILETSVYTGAISELLRGKLLYRDIYPLFGPLTYLLPSWLMKLTRPDVQVLRLLFVAGWTANFILVYWTARLVLRAPTRAAITMLAVITVVDYRPFIAAWGGYRYTGTYLSLFLLLLAIKRMSGRAALFAGLSAGLEFLLDQGQGLTSIAFGILPLSVGVIAIPRLRRPLYSLVIHYVMGTAAIAGLFFVYLASCGLVAAFLQDARTLHFKLFWIQSVRPHWADIVAFGFIFVTSGLIASGLARKSREIDARNWLIGVALLFATLISGIYALRSTTGPQKGPSEAMACVAAAWLIEQSIHTGAGTCPEEMRPRRLTLPERLLGGGLYLFVIFSLAVDWLPNSVVINDKTDPLVRCPLDRMSGMFMPASDANELSQIVHEIKRRSGPSDPLLGYPDLGLFNFLADRPALDRFTTPEFAAPNPLWRSELTRDLEGKPPRLVLLRRAIGPLEQTLGANDFLIPEVRDFVLRAYVPVAGTRRFVLYELPRQRTSCGDPASKSGRSSLH